MQKETIGPPATRGEDEIAEYLRGDSKSPLFLAGDALDLLRTVPAVSIDMCMTSPPYWGHREYGGGGIGQEERFQDYIANLMAVFFHVRRVLKPSGSFWLNLGDTYQDKRLLGIPWRVAIKLGDEQKWTLRNSIIWNKVKGGPDNSKDKLRNVHEPLFHFVKEPKDYFYDIDAIRRSPAKAKIVNGAVVSATGVSGIRYRRQIELSTALSEAEKTAATEALNRLLADVQEGKLNDFRMIIRGQQRATHSDSSGVSGRARELAERGFCFLKYHPNGSKPGDVWDILPEDTQDRQGHFAPYPEDLCRMPILATCPEGGTIIDPFCGTGTTMRVARQMRRKSIGMDISREYVELARRRCMFLP